MMVMWRICYMIDVRLNGKRHQRERYCSNKRKAHLLGPIVPHEINCSHSISLVMSGLESSTTMGGYNGRVWFQDQVE